VTAIGETASEMLTAATKPCEHIVAVKAEMERQNVRIGTVVETPFFICFPCNIEAPMELER
jgi:hypothetical protein